MLLTCHTKHFHSMTAVQTIEADHHMVLWFFKKKKTNSKGFINFLQDISLLFYKLSCSLVSNVLLKVLTGTTCCVSLV